MSGEVVTVRPVFRLDNKADNDRLSSEGAVIGASAGRVQEPDKCLQKLVRKFYQPRHAEGDRLRLEEAEDGTYAVR